MNVAPHSVSGRVVYTRRSPTSVGKFTSAPMLRPIQLRCINLLCSGQSTVSKSAIKRSLYAVMRKNHCNNVFFSTSAPLRQPRPSTTSSFANTVLSTGSQLTTDGARYARRKLDKNSFLSFFNAQRQRSAEICGVFGNSVVPFSFNSFSSSEIGRARFMRGSYHELYNFRKIHCVHR